MLLYRSPATDAIRAGLPADPSGEPDRWDEPEDVHASAGVVALRPGQVYQPGAGGAWLAGNTGPVQAGESMVFYRPVAVLPVRRRRNGAVLAAGWLPEHVRLGVLEALLPAGLVDRLVAQVSGVRETQRRRLMSAGLVVRFVLALVLWPEADYVEVMRRLVGDLPALPWQRPWQVPSSRVISTWRARVPATLFEQLFWAVAGPLAGAREPGLYVNGLMVCALDGFMVDLPATEANRDYFTHAKGKRGTGPFPQLRAVVLVACATRGALAAAVDRPRYGEQSLTRRLVRTHPQAFGPGRLVVMDRNYPGFKLIHAIRTEGAHVLIRIKAGIKLPVHQVLPDGSFLTILTDRRSGASLVLRVVEYNVTVPGQGGVSETFTLATSLLDPTEWTVQDLRQAYPLRWSGVETTIGENKSAITDAGPSRGPMLRAEAPEQVLQEFWAWLVTTQLIRTAGAHAVVTANTGQVRLGTPSRPRDTTTNPVTSRQVGFTTTRRAVAATVWRTTPATAQALAAQAQASAAVILSDLAQTDRHRYKPRRSKWRPGFPHTSTTLPTHRGPAIINPFPVTGRYHDDTS